MKIALSIAYDGSSYSGWQKQAGTDQTVQHKLERAISKVADQDVTVYCAGRTDAGVHALNQVVHYETDAIRSLKSWHRGINTNLPHDVNVRQVYEVEDAFHARFSANRRDYTYIIDNGRTSCLSLNRQRSSWVYEPLDIMLMQTAADYLVGEHDFSAFRASECQAKSPVKTVHYLNISREGDYIFLRVSANAFLHHMVRNIAGVLISIGAGKQPVEWCEDVLNSGDRRCGGVTAPAQGLYLTAVGYPEKFNIVLPAADVILAS